MLITQQEHQQQQQQISHRQKYNQVPNNYMCHDYAVTCLLLASTGVSAVHNQFLYSDTPPPCPSFFWLAHAILSQTFTCTNTLAISSQLSFLLKPPMKMEQTGCSKMSAHKIQTQGNHPNQIIKLEEWKTSLVSLAILFHIVRFGDTLYIYPTSKFRQKRFIPFRIFHYFQ